MTISLIIHYLITRQSIGHLGLKLDKNLKLPIDIHLLRNKIVSFPSFDRKQAKLFTDIDSKTRL